MPRWLVSVREDPTLPLLEQWSGFIAGQGGKAVNSTLVISNVNSARLTEARMRLVDETRALLEQGLIAPLAPAE